MNMLRDEGFDIVARSAGSHSALDIFAIDLKNKSIRFIQSKPKSMSGNAKNKLQGTLPESGIYQCTFEVL